MDVQRGYFDVGVETIMKVADRLFFHHRIETAPQGASRDKHCHKKYRDRDGDSDENALLRSSHS